ncbi:alpha/beta hydrolase [Halobacteriales archaeon QS_8_69_26]|nr:MAG: alpha/beta hydrolase [Halobacteriales archaeon QS_8_69_26]
METVTHHARKTAYRRWDRGGDGAGLLCIHGSGGVSEVWKSQARLGDERPVVALDLSGHGESEDVDADPGFETLSAYAEDAVAVAEATGARIPVGHSMGGAVALHLVLDRGFDPPAMVLAGTGPRMPVLDDLLEWLDGDFDRAVEFLHAPGRLFHDPTDDLRSVSEAAMRANGRAVTRRDFRTCHWFDVADHLGGVDAPTLAVVGEHDRLTPRWYHEEMAEGIPDCELAVIEDAGHAAMVEEPAAFNDTLRDFLG